MLKPAWAIDPVKRRPPKLAGARVKMNEKVGGSVTAASGTHSVKALPEKSVGQYRAMRQSMRGKFGILGNVESVT